MNRLCRTLNIILIFLLLASGDVAGAQTPAHPASENSSPQRRGDAVDRGAIEPDLLRILQENPPEAEESIRVIVTLRESPSLAAVGAAATRRELVAAMQEQATRSQAALRALLEQAQAAGEVSSYTSFWIFNGFAVVARPAFIRALAAHPDVAAVTLDHYRQYLPPNSLLTTPLLPNLLTWGVSRIRADEVWASLHISGTGAVVAGMDTGVDGFHPALQASYRGYNPHGPANHLYNWFDAIGMGARYPVDGHGHGTHTLGTMVGAEGVGVAPGARWIAVRVLDSAGSGYDSWIHAGFQWLLAPGGDPVQAPDVVNCSWGNPNGYLTTFQADLQALRAAGIFAVFANGNNGPEAGTVGSPASLPGAFAVGAADFDDETANFSSRGPSPWDEIRPHVVAPGVNVRSTLPGGAFGAMSGTSMAAPHVAGVVALMRSVSSTLSITRAASIITSTAVPLGEPIPNNDFGWGRVDAFAAVAALIRPGAVAGQVREAWSGRPISGATVTAVAHDGETRGAAVSGSGGAYTLTLASSVYDVTAAAFGYAPWTIRALRVVTDALTRANFALAPLPSGLVRGRIVEAATGKPISAAVSLLDTPLATVGDVYAFTPPPGLYTLRAYRLGYRILTATVAVAAGGVYTVDFALPAAPSILLVDSGAWYYQSQATYFRRALDELGYAYDERVIKHPPGDTPTAAALAAYDIVVWSAPGDSPGIVGAGDVISDYLSGGGRLLLSGQDVGFWDGGGSFSFWAPYYDLRLKARFVADDAPTRALAGAAGELFAGMTLTIAGAGGADNQTHPDVVAAADVDAAGPVWIYQGDGCGGLRVGFCLPYRALYLAFGFEAINDPYIRREVMRRAIDWLIAPPPTVGLELRADERPRVGLPGATVTHTVRLRHTGQGGVTDTVTLSLSGATWESHLSAPTVILTPCAVANIVLSVTIPPSAGSDARDVAALTARSTLSPTLMRSIALTSKTPAPILLVDDDRWYDQEAKYEAALTAGGLPYDYWRTGALGNGPAPEILLRYPIVVWFTGYDWYMPVTVEEEAALRTYLDQGGRLFLSSQDFLYYHGAASLTRDYLGVLSYTEEVTPTLAVGAPEDPIGDRLGALPLSYPFRNFSDALIPAPGAATPFRDGRRRPIALARRGAGYRTVFFSFPFEALPEAIRPEVMERIVGWLSWLGGSTFTAGYAGGNAVTYTLALRNNGPATVTASLSNTLPADLTLVPGSVSAPALYDPLTRRVEWRGTLAPGAALTVTYGAVVSGSGEIVNTARLGLEDQGVFFRRAAVTRVNAPDLSPSIFSCATSPARPGAAVTCTLELRNAGPAGAPAAEAVIFLPGNTTVTESARWSGPLPAGGRTTLTYPLSLPGGWMRPLYGVAFLEDGTGGKWERPAWIIITPQRVYLPMVVRNLASSARRSSAAPR